CGVQIGEEAGDGADAAVEGGKCRGVVGGQGAQILRRPARIGPQRDRGSVGLRREDPYLRPDQPQAMGGEAEVPDHRGSKPADRLSEAEDASHSIAAFHDEHARAVSGEVRPGHQAVVAGADYHRVVARDSAHYAALLERRMDFSTCIAAILPGAPMIPPPGCVAEPHIQRLRIGVRYAPQPATGRLKNSCSNVSSPWKMLPSVRPKVCSMSSGVNTCRCRMMSRMFGARSAIISTTAS